MRSRKRLLAPVSTVMYGLSSRAMAPSPSVCLTRLPGKLQEAPPSVERYRNRPLENPLTSLVGAGRSNSRQK
jgi:hypothetical protein